MRSRVKSTCLCQFRRHHIMTYKSIRKNVLFLFHSPLSIFSLHFFIFLKYMSATEFMLHLYVFMGFKSSGIKIQSGLPITSRLQLPAYAKFLSENDPDDEICALDVQNEMRGLLQPPACNRQPVMDYGHLFLLSFSLKYYIISGTLKCLQTPSKI